MLPRVLRVVRAKAIGKTANAQAATSSRDKNKNLKNFGKPQIYNPKTSSQDASLQGRAGKLLGRAGAAQFKKREGSGANETVMGKRGDGRKASGSALEGIAKSPEAIVFEGYRASAKSGKPKDLKMGGSGGKKGKGKPRSSKRASDWKKGGKSK
jgi:nucleolar protein 12